MSESIISEILELWGSFLFQNIGNLIVIPKMQKKMPPKNNNFLDDLAELGKGKFSLLIREDS